MKTRLTILFLLAITGLHAQPHRFRIAAGYQYLFAGEWDKAIQTYNAARPFLPEEQPLLMHSPFLSATCKLGGKGNFTHHVGLGYSLCTSAAENENLNSVLRYHACTPVYLLHYADSTKENGFFADFSAGLIGGLLLRRINGEPLLVDDTRLKAGGIGPLLGIHFGYCFPVSEKISAELFTGASYSPFYFSPGTESVINQTKGMAAKRWTGLLLLPLGLRVSL